MQSIIPRFSYSGQCKEYNEINGNWRIEFLSSGIFIINQSGTWVVDIFLVGAGSDGSTTTWSVAASGGGSSTAYLAVGGGGGYTRTEKSMELTGRAEYVIAIGAPGRVGGTSSFASTLIAEGGQMSSATQFGSPNGGNGGSGGSLLCVIGYGSTSLTGGTNGLSGKKQGNISGNEGTGQGSTTREFGEPDGKLYSNGGSACYNGGALAAYLETNMGHGGHGTTNASLKAGQPGKVIIRNHREQEVTI